jgi:hypothetical protein
LVGGGGVSIAINKHILGAPLERPISEAYSIQMAQILLLAHILKILHRPILIVALMKISAGVLVKFLRPWYTVEQGLANTWGFL